MKIELPLEVRSTPEISVLWDQYENLLQAFKEAHKENDQAVRQGIQTRELRSDLEAMEKERDTGQAANHLIICKKNCKRVQ